MTSFIVFCFMLFCIYKIGFRWNDVLGGIIFWLLVFGGFMSTFVGARS